MMRARGIVGLHFPNPIHASNICINLYLYLFQSCRWVEYATFIAIYPIQYLCNIYFNIFSILKMRQVHGIDCDGLNFPKSKTRKQFDAKSPSCQLMLRCHFPVSTSFGTIHQLLLYRENLFLRQSQEKTTLEMHVAPRIFSMIEVMVFLGPLIIIFNIPEAHQFCIFQLKPYKY